MAFLRSMFASLWVALWVLSGIPAAQAQPANDIKPVAAWTFNQPTLGLARDVASQTHHAQLFSTPRYESSPGGKALVFEGDLSRVAVADHPSLVMTDSVTVDVWAKIDDLSLPEPQTLVDKGGERYRLQVEPGGSVLFGLKNDAGRFDLTVGVVCRDRQALHDVLVNRIRPIPGILEAEVLFLLKLLKDNYQWSPATEAPERD